MQTEYIDKELVLLGGGHAHVGILKAFGMKPLKGVRLTLISDVSWAPYSGMIPGHISGFYTKEQCHIDLWPLANFAKARYLKGTAVGLDLKQNYVLLENRPPVPFDVLSINTGSTPQGIPGSDKYAIAAKPISHLLSHLDRVVHQLVEQQQNLAADVVFVGAGAGGVELCLSLQVRIHKELQKAGKHNKSVRFHLVFNGDQPATGHNSKIQKIFNEILTERNIQLYPNHKRPYLSFPQIGRILLRITKP